MSEIPNCPACGSEYAYEDRTLFVCPDCSHEWEPGVEDAEGESGLVGKMPMETDWQMATLSPLLRI